VTRLLVDPVTDFDDDGTGPVTITATLLDPHPATVTSFTVTSTADVVDLPAPAPSAAWRLTARRSATVLDRWNIPRTTVGPVIVERTVHWTGTSPVAWSALTEVDPSTLAAAGSSPLLDTSLDELRQTLLGGASTAFDTLKELETALGDDANFAATVTAALAGKVPALTAVGPKTANYTAAANELVKVDPTSGPVTITLPTAPADKTRVLVKRIDASSSNTVTIARGGSSDVFNRAGGSTTLTLTLPLQAVTVQYDATGGIWVVHSGDLPLAQLDGRYMTPAAVAATYVTFDGTSLKQGGQVVPISGGGGGGVSVVDNGNGTATLTATSGSTITDLGNGLAALDS
jgi:hypothetical protein